MRQHSTRDQMTQKLTTLQYRSPYGFNKGNSSIPLFEIHKLIEENKSELQTKTERNASNIRELRHNRNIKM